MFFDIQHRPSYLQYSTLYNDLLSDKTHFKDFTPFCVENAQMATLPSLISAHKVGVLNEKRCRKDDTSTELEQYLFWLYSISKEIRSFRTKEPDQKYLESKVVLDEAENMIINGTYNNMDQGPYHILVYYDIDENGVLVYIGSIYYQIKVGGRIPYRKNEDGGFDRVNDDQRTLFFISIYKSILNRCMSCSDKSFSLQMIDAIYKRGKENGCLCVFTNPIGKMNEILNSYGFEYGMKTIVYRDKDIRRRYKSMSMNKKRTTKTKSRRSRTKSRRSYRSL